MIALEIGEEVQALQQRRRTFRERLRRVDAGQIGCFICCIGGIILFVVLLVLNELEFSV